MIRSTCPRACFASFVLAATASANSDLPMSGPDPGWSSSLVVDYDQSRARTNAFRTGIDLAWGTTTTWIGLAGDVFTDMKSLDFRDNSFATIQLGHAIFRDPARRIYSNVVVDIDPHSLLAGSGCDISPQANLAIGLTDDWWIGGEAGGVLATSPDAGNRAGYVSLTLWLTWLCGFMPDGEDSLALGLWAAGNEVPGDDRCLFMEAEYSFAVGESMAATLGVGTDIISPWDHLGVYFAAGIEWQF